ncbi:hypothetical protein I6F21_14960 [Bradyrhizobium sp. NBAIM03]|uniref:hypothetical protein n=1 Tax=Bradyrhizobium sp. NBAIM03 TaxID=2793816 RepID=UPI001CD5788E|nr:hypothetical protein [Bradyrhizobium sp. NBAIM03]MCA1533860.1 hypothetical protein [Bradyrhizobium sp. NBAIM03]
MVSVDAQQIKVDIHHLFWLSYVMSSLKTFLHDISGRLRMSPAALYERQRELVRHGLLPVREGRGPGSGVPLTPETVATFLIGLLATDSLTDLAERTAGLSAAKPVILGSQPPASTRTFHSDLAAALIDEANGRYMGVQVTRHWRGLLLLDRPMALDNEGFLEGVASVEYVVSEEARVEAPVLAHTVSLEAEYFWMVCHRLRGQLGLIKPPPPPPDKLVSGGGE